MANHNVGIGPKLRNPVCKSDKSAIGSVIVAILKLFWRGVNAKRGKDRRNARQGGGR